MNSGWFCFLPLTTWVVEMLTTAGISLAVRSAKLSGALRDWPATGINSKLIVAAANDATAGREVSPKAARVFGGLDINVPITNNLLSTRRRNRINRPRLVRLR